MILSKLKNVNNTTYYRDYRIIDNNINPGKLAYLLSVKEDLCKSFHNFNYMIENLDKLTQEQFLAIYNTFYTPNSKEILKRITVKSFKNPIVVAIKSNDSEYIVGKRGFYNLDYIAIKDKDTFLDTNKVYTLKEIEKLIQDKKIIFAGKKKLRERIDHQDIENGSNQVLSNALNSTLAFNIIKSEFTKENMINDYNQSILNYRSVFDDLNKALSEYKKEIQLNPRNHNLSSIPHNKMAKFPLKRNK